MMISRKQAVSLDLLQNMNNGRIKELRSLFDYVLNEDTSDKTFVDVAGGSDLSLVLSLKNRDVEKIALIDYSHKACEFLNEELELLKPKNRVEVVCENIFDYQFSCTPYFVLMHGGVPPVELFSSMIKRNQLPRFFYFTHGELPIDHPQRQKWYFEEKMVRGYGYEMLHVSSGIRNRDWNPLYKRFLLRKI